MNIIVIIFYFLLVHAALIQTIINGGHSKICTAIFLVVGLQIGFIVFVNMVRGISVPGANILIASTAISGLIFKFIY